MSTKVWIDTTNNSFSLSLLMCFAIFFLLIFKTEAICVVVISLSPTD